MRKTVTRQLPLVPALRAHAHVAELEKMSETLDSNPEIAEAIHADLVREVDASKGREGLSGDQVLRAAILYQTKGWSFDALAFELAYHTAYRWFCRLSWKDCPSESALHRDIGRIQPQTWARIEDIVLRHAIRLGIEDGRRVRTDCTVTEVNIHEPSDSALLWDCVRVLTDKLDRASELVNVSYSDHRKRAKRRAFAIRNAKRMKQRIRPYKDLLKVTRRTLGYAKRAAHALAQRRHPHAQGHCEELQKILDLTVRVIDQTERRVLRDESVPANEKVVSIFEPHTDVIRKDGRETLYGHKICLSVGASNLITDCVILDGNPADSTLTTEMMRHQVERFGRAPEQAAFDGAFGSKENLRQLKEDIGIRDVAFSKAKWASVSDMVKDSWTYRRLREFRAGVEGVISFLKRAFGLRRCRRRGKRAFEAHVRSSVVAANLLILARHALR